MPKNPPPEAKAALAEYIKKEEEARRRGARVEQDVREFLAAFYASYGNRAPGSQLELAKAIAVFLEWCAAEKLRRLDRVDAAACHRWMAHRAATRAKWTGQPLAFATLRKERSLLARAWSEALLRGEVDRNPWDAVAVPGKPLTKARGSWSPAQVEKLLAVSRPWLRDLVLVGCHTGLRIGALRQVEWRDVRWAGPGETGYGFLVVRPALDKAGKGYRVPIDRVCRDVLARRLVHRDPQLAVVLTGDKGHLIRRSNPTEKAIRGACRRAGLPRPDSPNHHMRRTFGRQAVLGQLTGRPIPIYVVSKWLGHSTVQMTERYLALSHDDSARWMEEVERAAQSSRCGQADAGQAPVAT